MIGKMIGMPVKRLNLLPRYDEDGPLALLLVTSGWIERDEIDVV